MADFRVVIPDTDSAITRWSNECPKIVDNVLQTVGADEIMKNIRDLIPVSNRNKKHAKDGVRFGKRSSLLTVTISASGKYGYLVFPDEGRGAHNPEAQEFFRRGAETSAPTICRMIEEQVSSKL